MSISRIERTDSFAREMNRKAYNERLREIQMSEHDAAMYEQFSSQVFLNTPHIQCLFNSCIKRM